MVLFSCRNSAAGFVHTVDPSFDTNSVIRDRVHGDIEF